LDEARKATLAALSITQEADSVAAYYWAAMLALKLDDHAWYREICAAMLGELSNTKVAVAAHFAAWTATLAPNALDDYASANKLARRALQSNPRDEQFLTGLGAILFRAGDFPNALTNLTAALKASHTGRTSSAYIHYFLAMTHYRLGNHAEATKALRTANRLAERELNNSARPAPWNRQLTLRLLRAETEGLLGRLPIKAHKPKHSGTKKI
jgi:tetratricopeptide (TPR) repeat protein